MLISLRLGGFGFSFGFSLRLDLGSPWKGVKVVLKIPRFGSPDRLIGRVPRRPLKDTILRLVRLEALGVVGLGKMLLRGKPTLLQHLIQHTLKVGTGVLVPQTETILLLQLLDHHAQLRFPG